ncbi:SDR family NAD(P)-dependent oxidoreductase [Micromonospora sp. NIE79]|uniref:SDR family NAD(P)-dependent oxidoreductase n=1 Tax=Micromonospora trifolii TaxID=2911208 RepID=A0ABS9N2C9_9ACTN|nr:SDR family NAD(P)-dependent oxidoreductase [Micromonospora trifolii]MCG5444105.1 SDR family NAD(P)-dependent oxidoreductase [Micromonospora trifolii]
MSDGEVRELDLASLASVRTFAAKLAGDHPAIDLLVNNAGVVLLGPRRTSADGFELHLATNMLGHFVLTGLLLGNLAAAREARVVSLSSITHRNAHLDFNDLMFEHDYRATTAYGRSKLATTIFGIELDRRLRAAGTPIVSALAHPGLTRTNLTPRAWEHRGRFGRLSSGIRKSTARGHHGGDGSNPGFRLIGKDERQNIDWKGAGRRADPDRG